MSQLDAQLPEAIRQLMSRVRRALQNAFDAAGLDITPPEAHILHLLQSAPDTTLTPLQLANQSGYDKAFVARKLKAMQECGLLTREADPHDQRRVRLKLTAAGKRLGKKVGEARRQAHGAVFNALPIAEQRQLVELLNKCL